MKLALLLASWGPEICLAEWCAWFGNWRAHPNKFPHIRELYKMREGTPFAVAYKQLIEGAGVAEALAPSCRPMPKAKARAIRNKLVQARTIPVQELRD